MAGFDDGGADVASAPGWSFTSAAGTAVRRRAPSAPSLRILYGYYSGAGKGGVGR